jgi:outer membrane immunogenic protein
MSTRAKLAASAALALALLTSAATPSLAGPAPIWDGLYLGGHVGGAFGTDEYKDRDFDGKNRFGGTEGLVGGIHVGYNVTTGPVVLGVEGDYSWSDAEGSKTFTDVGFVANFTSTTNNLASIRGRVGMPVQNMLFYATAGVAWTEWEVAVKINDAGVRTNLSFSDTMIGYVVGGGVEAKFTQNLSGRIEGLYYSFEDAFKTQGGTTDVSRDITVVRAGLSYHFN